MMTTIDEKLKLEVSKLLQTDFKLEDKKHRNDTVLKYKIGM